jgi:hypothetical protein
MPSSQSDRGATQRYRLAASGGFKISEQSRDLTQSCLVSVLQRAASALSGARNGIGISTVFAHDGAISTAPPIAKANGTHGFS